MSGFFARVYVTPKRSVRDPEGSTIQTGLKQLGFDAVQGVRAGKYFELSFEAGSSAEAESTLDRICRQLLANPVIEDFRFDFQIEPSTE